MKKQTKTKGEKSQKGIYEIMGVKSTFPYKTNNIEQYENYLKSLSLFELQEHAVKVGLKASSDREKSYRTLIGHFKRELAKAQSTSSTTVEGIETPLTLDDIMNGVKHKTKPAKTKRTKAKDQKTIYQILNRE